MHPTHIQRLKLAQQSLLGLAVGDAFGQQFFLPKDQLDNHLTNKSLPPAPWHFTDDTIMAMGVYDTLQKYGEINQDALARILSQNYQKDPTRGYGGTAHRILREINSGQAWKTVSSSVFDGMGSMGNGAAMRAGIIGAYFYDDMPEVIEQARLSADVTHFHKEGQIGAMGVAVAAALACQIGHKNLSLSPNEFLEAICSYIPDSETLSRTKRGIQLSPMTNIQTVVSILGNGSDMSAQQTIPFTLWVAAHNLTDYESALWATVNGLGDRDTTCAIVGSIVALYTGQESIPPSWLQATESIYNSPFLDFIM
jgi:ADP-ribosylglycohydrolase